jgi:hypothetical protein
VATHCHGTGDDVFLAELKEILKTGPPLSYISLNTYLVICALAGLSLIFYRVGLWIFGVLACALLTRCFASIYRKVVSNKGRRP